MISCEACGRGAVRSVSPQRSTGVFEQDSLILEFLECRGGFDLCAERRSQASLDACDWPVGGLGSVGLLEARGQKGLETGPALSWARARSCSVASRGQSGHRCLSLLFVSFSCPMRRMHSCRHSGRESLCVLCLKPVTTLSWRRQVLEWHTAPPLAHCGKDND